MGGGRPRPGGSHHQRQRRAGSGGGGLASGRAGCGRPLAPLVLSARAGTYLTEPHRVSVFYYRQSQGQALLPNKRDALSGLLLTCLSSELALRLHQTRRGLRQPLAAPAPATTPCRGRCGTGVGGPGAGLPLPKPLLSRAQGWPSLLQDMGCPGITHSWGERRERPAAARRSGPCCGSHINAPKPHVPCPPGSPASRGRGMTGGEPQVTFLAP